MEACNSTSCLFGAPGGFLDAATYRYITIILRLVFNPATSLPALCASFINISTFFKMDLRQGVNLNLLILSFSDCMIGFVILAGYVSHTMIWLGYRVLNGFSFYAMLSFCRFTVLYPIHMSIVITTIIAIVRCLSVVMPMKFRSIITNERQSIAIAIVGCLSILIPLHTHISWYSYIPITNPNSSYYGLTYMQRYPLFDVFRNTLFYTCLIINVFSIVLLIVSLKRSSRFQSQNSSQHAKPEASRKETQVIKTVILVLAIFVGCNMPLMLLAVLRQAIPGFSDTGRYRYEKGVWDMIVLLSVNLNVGLNLFAYYSTNSTFRKIVRSQVLHINSNVHSSSEEEKGRVQKF